VTSTNSQTWWEASHDKLGEPEYPCRRACPTHSAGISCAPEYIVDDHHSRNGPREAGVSYVGHVVRLVQPMARTVATGLSRPLFGDYCLPQQVSTREIRCQICQNGECYADLFGEGGAALSDAAWIARANDSLPPILSALNARFVTDPAGSGFCRSLIGPVRSPSPSSASAVDVSPKCSIKHRRTAARS
jgi:hypothetical protein